MIVSRAARALPVQSDERVVCVLGRAARLPYERDPPDQD
jgi:hypothetical protein